MLRAIWPFLRGAMCGMASVLTALTFGESSASAYPLRRDVIVAYSVLFWNNQGANGPYSYYSNNCTNFVSQSWFGANLNLPFNQQQHGGPETDNQWFPGLNAWSVAQAFVNYQNLTGPGIQKLIPTSPGSTEPWTRLTRSLTPGLFGAAVIYRTGDGGGSGNYWTHAAITTGSQYVGTHTDSRTGLPVVYNTTVDQINSHTRHRQREPWNIGFRIEQQTLSSETLLAHKANWDAIVIDFA